MKKKILLIIVVALLSATSAFAQGGTTGPLTWQLTGTAPNLTLTISGNDTMPDYTYSNLPWREYQSDITTVIIEDGVTSVGNRAFYYFNTLTSITLPNTITRIGNFAFYASGIWSVNFGDKLINIGDNAFSGCYSLTSITIPSSVTSIGASAFSACGMLTSINVESENINYFSEDGVLFNKNRTLLHCYPAGKSGNNYTIPNSVIIIGNGAFNGCALNSIIIPNGVTTIEYGAFYGCGITSITIPSSVTSIEDYFGLCGMLTSINVESENMNYSSEDGVLFNKNKTHLIRYPEGKSGNSYVIPNSVIEIGNWAFWQCKNLISIAISNNTTAIGQSSFYWTGITSITLPSSITSIGNSAFSNSYALTSITNLNPIPVEFHPSSWVFGGVDTNVCSLTVPTSAVLAYQNAEIWNKFNIVGGGILVYPKASNPEYGYVTGNELYEGRATATVAATAFEGYKFKNWTKNGEVVSTNNPYSFTVTEDIELVANFEEEVGIEKFKLSTLKIYPNPTIGELRITSKETELAFSLQDIVIFDKLGRNVGRNLRIAQDETGAILTDISHLPSGIYFLRIKNEIAKIVKL